MISAAIWSVWERLIIANLAPLLRFLINAGNGGVTTSLET